MTAARYLCLGLPLLAVLAAGRLERGRDARAAALLAFIAAATGIAALGELGRWYSFAPVDGAFRGMPVDLWLGWAVLWGALPVLCRRLLPVPVALGLLLWLDVVTMPLLHPLVRLEPGWLAGELLGLVLVALPAQLLGRWSADRRRLTGRVLLQVATFTGTTMWLVPSIVFEYGDGSWKHVTDLPIAWLFAIAQLMLVVAAPALLAVRELAVRGGGTPYPWDPPHRLVTTGPYAFVANPMQLSTVVLLAVLAAATRSWALLATVVAAAAFSAGVAAPHERHAMRTRFGVSWVAYRRSVRDWLPRPRPWLPGPAATIWLDTGCPACRATGRFLVARGARGLTIRPAHEHQPVLWRSQYADGDGHRERGVAAVARALEHTHLGWAWTGWLLRLPGVTWLAQVVSDAMIAAPHPAASRGGSCPATPNSA